MKKIKIEILCFTLALLLLLFFCAGLSYASYRTVKEIRQSLLGLPPDLPKEKEERAALLEKVKKIEEDLRSATSFLSFFVKYDLINSAEISSSAFSASLYGDENADYAITKRAFAESLESIMRQGSISLEIII